MDIKSYLYPSGYKQFVQLLQDGEWLSVWDGDVEIVIRDTIDREFSITREWMGYVQDVKMINVSKWIIPQSNIKAVFRILYAMKAPTEGWKVV